MTKATESATLEAASPRAPEALPSQSVSRPEPSRHALRSRVWALTSCAYDHVARIPCSSSKLHPGFGLFPRPCPSR
eukprot:scaffold14071_cov65-Phaeocystis_antarctica.AAC.8